jgi:hypothetical protein
MNKLIAPALIALALAAPAAAETRNLRDFDSVSASDRVEVEVVQGDHFAVEVTGPDADRVTTIVDDRDLRIRQRSRTWFGNVPRVDARVRVVMPNIEGLAAARGAELRATNINARELSLAAAMGGALSVTGACTTLDAAASMGGAIDAEGLQCRDADIAASMGGAVEVYASGRFDAAASMGGDVEVAGGGQRGDIATSMGGSVSQN